MLSECWISQGSLLPFGFSRVFVPLRSQNAGFSMVFCPSALSKCWIFQGFWPSALSKCWIFKVFCPSALSKCWIFQGFCPSALSNCWIFQVFVPPHSQNARFSRILFFRALKMLDFPGCCANTAIASFACGIDVCNVHVSVLLSMWKPRPSQLMASVRSWWVAEP